MHFTTFTQMMKVVIAILSIFLGCSSGSNLLPQVAAHHQQIENYLGTLHFHLDRNENSVAIVNYNFSQAETFLRSSMIFKRKPVMYINVWANASFSNFTKFEHVIVFLEHIQNMSYITDNLLEQPSVWFSNPKYYFVVLNPQNNDEKNVVMLLKQLWDHEGILDFVLVFTDTSRNLQILSYNPFEDVVQNYSQKGWPDGTDLFPNKLKDLRNYKVKIIDDLSKLYQPVNGNCTTGEVCNFLRIFLNRLNARAELVEPSKEGDPKSIYKQAKEDLRRRRAEISLNQVWLFEQEVMFGTYPLHQSNLIGIIAVPKPLPVWMNLFYVFDHYIWVLLVLVKIIFIGLKIADKKIGLYSVATGLNTLVLFNQMYNIIFQNLFQGAIITALTTPKYEKLINTVDDIVKSGLKVYGESSWQQFLVAKINLTHKSLFDNTDINTFRPGEINLSFEGLKKFLLLMKFKNGGKLLERYRFIKEPLGVGRLSIYIRRNSPFRDIINNIIFTIGDYGLDLFFAFPQSHVWSHTARASRLTLTHLLGAFLPLMGGLGLAILVFLIEKYIVAHKNIEARKNF